MSFFFQAEDGIRDLTVTGVQTCALPISAASTEAEAAPAVALPEALDVNQLQALDPAEIEKLCRDFELRVYPGRSRHHLILDLVRAALGRKIPVTATGFFDPVADAFAVLRWPRLNFLPVPED